MDQTASSTWAKLAVISACAIVPLFGAGCEDAQSKADRKIRQVVYAAELAMYEDGGADKASELLQTATQTENAGDASKADAYLRMAQADYARAIAKLPALTEREAKVNEAISAISQLGLRLAANNELISIYKGNDPTNATQGDPLKVLQDSKARCAALAKELNTKIADTKKQIDAKTAEIAALESNRAKAATDADTLLAQSEQAKGQASLDAYKKALDARSAAASLGYNIANAKTMLARLQQTSMELQQQVKIAQEGSAAADKQLAQLSKASADVKKAINARISVGKGLATQGAELFPGGKAREAGIEAKAKDLAAVLANAEAQRKDVDADLLKAIEAYEQAAGAANRAWAVYGDRLRDEVPTGSPSRPAIQKLQRLYSPLSYNMDRSRALQARGGIYASYARLLESKQQLIQTLAPIFKQANFQLPAELNPQSLPKQIQEAKKIAEQCYDEASRNLEDAMERGEPAEKAAAQFPRISVQYSQYTLTGQPKYLESARALLKEVATASGGEENAQNGPTRVLPNLPLELEQGIIKRTAAKASGNTEAASQPATTPAGGAAAATPADDNAAAPADGNAAPTGDAKPADEPKAADDTKSLDAPTRGNALQRALRPLRPGAR